MMESETPPLAAPTYEAGDPEVSSRRVSSSLDPEKGRQASTVAVGEAEGSARACIRLRRTPYVDEHGDRKEFIRGKWIVRGRQEFTDRL